MTINSSALYKTVNIDGVVDGFLQRTNNYFLGQYVPLKTYNKDKIELDVAVTFRGGATPLSARGASAPIFNPTSGRSKRLVETPVWKEKIETHSEELYDFRELGQHDVLKGVASLVRWKMELLSERLEARMELMRRDVIFNQRLVASNDRGNSVAFTYNDHPVDFRPTVGTAWSNAAADPIGDVQDWVEHFRRHSTMKLESMHFPIGTVRDLVNVTGFQNLRNANYGDFKGNVAAIMNEFAIQTGVGNIRESDDAIQASAPITSAVAAGSTDTITVEHTWELAVGDEIRIVRISDRLDTLYTVVALTDTTIQLDRNVDEDIYKYDAVYWQVFTIPANKVLILGAPRYPIATNGKLDKPNINTQSLFMEVASTRVLDANIQSAVSGVYRKTVDRLGEDPSRVEDLLGINAIPRIHNGKGWMIADIG